MSNRIVKQIIFGAFYSILFAALGYGLYFILIEPAASCFDNRQNQKEEQIDCGGSCMPCAIKNLQPISVFSPPQFLTIDNGTGAVYFRLKNPNPNYGADQFSYTLDFYDAAGVKINSLTETSYIYAGRIKPIAIVPVKVAARSVARVEVSISGINWRTAEEFPMPAVQSRAIRVEFLQDQAKVGGIIFNNNSFTLSRAIIGVLTADKLGRLVSASKTVLDNLAPFEERPFTVFVPLAGQFVDPNATEVFVESLR